MSTPTASSNRPGLANAAQNSAPAESRDSTPLDKLFESANAAAKNPPLGKAEVSDVVEASILLHRLEAETRPQVLKLLRARMIEEDTPTQYAERFDMFVFDGAYAMGLAMQSIFGSFRGVKVNGSMFSPEQLPTMLTIKSGVSTTVKIPWGRIALPGLATEDGHFDTGAHHVKGRACFMLSAVLKKQDADIFQALCEEIKSQHQRHSLYRGQAISASFLDSDGDPRTVPEMEFPDIATVNAHQLIFSGEIERALQANLYTPLEKSAECRELGIPLKRCIGLAGGYGTGKTMIAARVKEVAVSNGWTYIACKSADEFSHCVNFAHGYQPAVVFCEDIDRVISGDRDASMDDILNTIDGVDSKGTDIMLVLTTNDVENIHPGMMRPGRIDAVIEVKPPDAEATERILRHYGGDWIGKDNDFGEAVTHLSGSTPAVIREVVERAKLVALAARGNHRQPIQITGKALLIAAGTMKSQIAMLNREIKRPITVEEEFTKSLEALIDKGMGKDRLDASSIGEAVYRTLKEHEVIS